MFWAIAAVAVLVAAQAFAINYLGRNNYLPEGSEHWTEDWLIHYFSKRLKEPRKDIALVLVDTESLESAHVPATVPVDRGWMAKLITAAASAEPLAIGLDFYFANAIDPAKDEELAASIRDAKVPIVIAAVDDAFLRSDIQRAFQRDFIRRVGRRAGHIYLARSKEILSLGDRAVRAIDHGPSANGYASLTSTLASLPEAASAFGAAAIPDGSQRIDWQLPPERGEVFTSFSAEEILSPQPDAQKPDLKSKIILIGPDLGGLDRHNVPFSLGSQGPAAYLGVFIHAQALAQILDNRFFLSWTSGQQFLLLLLIGFLGAAVGWIFNGIVAELVLGLGGTLLLIALSVPFFLEHIPLPTALAILAWGASIWTAQQVRAWTRRH